MDALREFFVDIRRRIENLERGLIIKIITIPTDGAFIPKVVASDPASPKNNEVWINSTTNQLKWNKSGTIKTINFS
jgi:hypothetical protein